MGSHGPNFDRMIKNQVCIDAQQTGQSNFASLKSPCHTVQKLFKIPQKSREKNVLYVFLRKLEILAKFLPTTFLIPMDDLKLHRTEFLNFHLETGFFVNPPKTKITKTLITRKLGPKWKIFARSKP